MMPMTTNKVFVDSNIIIYLFDKPSFKEDISTTLLQNHPFINAQVLAEVGNICKKRLGFSKEQVIEIWENLLIDCEFVPVNSSTFLEAIRLIKRYQFQLFDGIIVASALQANCNILYSEDMQHNMLVDDRLRIVNPFKS
jgi:predicted nucleic acid-binding protein